MLAFHYLPPVPIHPACSFNPIYFFCSSSFSFLLFSLLPCSSLFRYLPLVPSIHSVLFILSTSLVLIRFSFSFRSSLSSYVCFSSFIYHPLRPCPFFSLFLLYLCLSHSLPFYLLFFLTMRFPSPSHFFLFFFPSFIISLFILLFLIPVPSLITSPLFLPILSLHFPLHHISLLPILLSLQCPHSYPSLPCFPSPQTVTPGLAGVTDRAVYVQIASVNHTHSALEALRRPTRAPGRCHNTETKFT